MVVVVVVVVVLALSTRCGRRRRRRRRRQEEPARRKVATAAARGAVPRALSSSPEEPRRRGDDWREEKFVFLDDDDDEEEGEDVVARGLMFVANARSTKGARTLANILIHSFVRPSFARAIFVDIASQYFVLRFQRCFLTQEESTAHVGTKMNAKGKKKGRALQNR